MNKIIIVDGNSLLFRAFYATYAIDKEKLMRNKDGVPTNAIFAFSNMITNLLKELKEGDGIFVAFDAGKHTFRHKEYSEYKANRIKAPEELFIQMPIAREFLDSLNIKYYETEDLEADDIAGTMALDSEKDGYKVEIYTSDKDYLQLIDDNITIKLIKKGLKDVKDMTLSSFKEEWGIEPKQIVDYKGLMGDSSDNLKGIPKVGDITAKKLIKEYGSLENIINAAPTFKSKIGESIINSQEQGKMCKHLAILKLDTTLPIKVNDTIYKGYELKNITDFINKYDLKSLINKLPINLRKKDLGLKEITYKDVNNISNLNVSDKIGISVDTSNENYHFTTFYGLLFTINQNTYYISKDNLLKEQKLLNILKDKNIKKYAFDYKRIKYVLENNNIEVNGLYFDLLIASYLLDSNLAPQIENVLSFYSIDVSYAFKNESSLFLNNDNSTLLEAISSYYSLNLYDEVIEEIKNKDEYDLLENIELPLTNLLESIEKEGFPLNKDELIEIGKIYKEKLDKVAYEIYEMAGKEFNIQSPRQVAQVLFDDLKLKTNTHKSTSVEHLKELIPLHPIVSKILEHRKYSKLITTYVDGLIPYIGKDNLIHATFNQALTSTGRLSSSEPNLQNISVRDEESKLIRKAFHYDDPSLNIISLDYSQIELRILAHLSNSQTLIDAFNVGEDIHEITARKVFHIEGELDPSLRRKAKAINFGIIYGISDWGLAEQINVSVSEAKEIITNFYNAFPEIKSYLDSLIENAVTKGYALTMFNRRRYIPEINSSIYQKREFAKRAAMNAPIQGSAADLIKIAMIKVNEVLIKNNFKARIISQIHDEILIRADDFEKEKVFNLAKETMENCVKLKVKLKVDGGYAKNWFNVK